MDFLKRIFAKREEPESSIAEKKASAREETAGNPLVYGETKEDAARYALEHKVLPNAFNSPNGEGILCFILEKKGEALVSFYQDIHKENGETDYVCPYRPEQFTVIPRCIHREGREDVYCTTIVMPEPERMPLCKMVMILHGRDFSTHQYYTVEKSVEDGEFAFCRWDRGRHVNYGFDTQKAMNEAIQNFGMDDWLVHRKNPFDE